MDCYKGVKYKVVDKICQNISVTFSHINSNIPIIHISLALQHSDNSKMDNGKQLYDRISELCMEISEQMHSYIGISRLFDDLRFVQREIKAHGTITAYGISVPSSIPDFLETIIGDEPSDTVQNMVWITGVLIPAYKERADKRVMYQNSELESYENSEGPLVPAAPGLDKYSLSDYYYRKMLEAEATRLASMEHDVSLDLNQVNPIQLNDEDELPNELPPLPGQIPYIFSMAPEVQELYLQGFFTIDGELAEGVTYSLDGNIKTLYKSPTSDIGKS